MFIVSLTYIAETTEIDKHLAEHIDYLEKNYRSGTFLASGRKVPRTGGVILAKTDSREALESILREDPFSLFNLAKYDVTEFVASKSASNLTPLINA